MKKIISIILTAVLLLTAIPIIANAAESYTHLVFEPNGTDKGVLRKDIGYYVYAISGEKKTNITNKLNIDYIFYLGQDIHNESSYKEAAEDEAGNMRTPSFTDTEIDGPFTYHLDYFPMTEKTLNFGCTSLMHPVYVDMTITSDVIDLSKVQTIDGLVDYKVNGNSITARAKHENIGGTVTSITVESETFVTPEGISNIVIRRQDGRIISPAFGVEFGGWHRIVVVGKETDGEYSWDITETEEAITEYPEPGQRYFGVFSFTDGIGSKVVNTWDIDATETFDDVFFVSEGEGEGLDVIGYDMPWGGGINVEVEMTTRCAHKEILPCEGRAATCTEPGYTDYTVCTNCGREFGKEIIPATGHKELRAYEDVEATCVNDGHRGGVYCPECYQVIERYEIVPASPEYHRAGEHWYIDIPATNTTEGHKYRDCIYCGTVLEEETIPVTTCPHEHTETINAVKAECETDGYTGDVYCNDCQTIIESGTRIPALGHDATPTCYAGVFCNRCGTYFAPIDHIPGENATCDTPQICERCLHELSPALGHDWEEEWTVDIEPTFDTPGEKSRHCSRCEGRRDVTVIPPLLIDSTTVFKDVKQTSWFKDAVDFVLTRGLMNGVTSDQFKPNGDMTRAMLVTVLWRLEGEPTPSVTVPFTDLKQDWYKTAVAWAYENQIVNGTSETKFSPNGAITREQMAAILFRYVQFKQYGRSSIPSLNFFPDHNKIHSYAVDAFKWAVSDKIIGGVAKGGTSYLDPRGKATRAQVATILQRFCETFVYKN